MRIIGDVHGQFNRLLPLIGDDLCLQVGDMCIGFPDSPYPTVLPPNFRFIRGNKDNPTACREHPNYLGDYGLIEGTSVYYISGAWSINWRYLRSEIDHWAEEELSYRALADMVEDYTKHKPRYVISHECPDAVFNDIFNRDLLPTRTASALGMLWERWQPKYWFFGHFHSNKEVKVGNTNFVCVGELEAYDLPGVNWKLPFAAHYTPPSKIKIPEITAKEMEYYIPPSKDQLNLGF